MTDFSYWHHLRRKQQYSGVLRLLIDALNRVGIEITPYYLMGEDCEAILDAPAARGLDVVHLEHDAMPQLAELPIRTRGLEALNELLDSGKRCLALTDGARVAAFCWYDLDECHYAGCRFDLADDEAYLFDAYTLPDYRGAGLAPHLRSALYRELASAGRRKLYSISAHFNKPAIRFKQKLGARALHLGVHVELFGMLRFEKVLKRYEDPFPEGPPAPIR